jgi:hypothetical protein
MPSLVGNKPNQVPSNGDLGTLAFQDSNAVNITGGVVDVSAGTAALPTLGTTGDPNTGVFFPAEDTMAVATNGAEALRVDSSGNVGIGVTPSDKLHVNGNIYLGTASRTIYTGGSGNLILQNNTGVTIFGRANGASESMRIDANGNVGVGVIPSAWGANYKVIESNGNAAAMFAAPSVNGVQLSSNTFHNGTSWTYKTTGEASRYAVNTGQHIWFNAASGTANAAITWTQAMTLNASGNLGIGTASPSTVYARTLHIASPAATSAAGVVYTDTQSAKTYAVGINSGFFQWYDVTAATERMRLDTNGNLLVGTTSIAGVASNNKVITNGGVLTNSGNLSVATATPTTIFSITAGNRGRYEVVAMVLGSGIPLGYTAIATVIWDGSGGRVVANNGTNLTITLSGSDVQVTQTAGSSQTIYWSFQRLALF